jgi:hypothetical protein
MTKEDTIFQQLIPNNIAYYKYIFLKIFPIKINAFPIIITVFPLIFYK